jgi:polyisoprenoid-binding protein YceI
MLALPHQKAWNIDTKRSSLTFGVGHALFGPIRGEFRCWGGQVLLDPRAIGQPSVHVWVDLSSLDTGSQRLDAAILDSELFDIRWQPGLVFDSDRLERTHDGQAVLIGWLGLHSFRKQISIDVTLHRAAPAADAEIVATARAAIDRRAFGLRRERRAHDWLSERFVGKIIEMDAHLVAEPAARAPTTPEEPQLAVTLSSWLAAAGIHEGPVARDAC